MPTDTKDRILEVAARLFAEQGYHATGVAGILRDGGVKSGSLYHFFSSKEDLLVAVMQRHLELLQPRILARAVTESQTSDPLDHVFSLLSIYRRSLVVSGTSLGCPVGSLALEVGSTIPRVRTLIEQYFDAWVAQVRTWLDEAGSRLPSALDRDALAHLVLAVAQGGIIQARAAESVDPYDTCVAQLRSTFELLVARTRFEHDDPRDALVGEPIHVEETGRSGAPDQFEWRAW
ncbi:MAG: TetR/AcrR family transcriptional regulator [Gemmatimonadales bacterium]|nr:MAG: TetR/AcrR family transcriptional regulator [Gemmatimonadales bacterium]